MPLKTRELGGTGILLSPIGLGCWQFSDKVGMTGGIWEKPADGELGAIVQTALDGGINWFDTAQMYGKGSSERALAKALLGAGARPGSVFVATKWWPLFKTAADFETSFADRETNLSPFPVDLIQIHQPFSLSSAEKQAMVLVRLLKTRKVRAVGVSNFPPALLRRVHKVLAGEGLVLASNQVRYSLNHRRIESDGTLDTAKELGVSIIAWSPLSQGLLSGRFHDNPGLAAKLPWMRRRMGGLDAEGLAATSGLVRALRETAKAHAASASQIALAATIALHGDLVFAIPGATKTAQASEAAASMGITLKGEELSRLDEESKRFR
jgi:aryl-alcohol dehydrogenase-like predicted oxidoreductase